MKLKNSPPFGVAILLLVASLLACDLSSLVGPTTPIVQVVTATPVPATATPVVIVVTATPEAAVPSPLPPIAPTVTPGVIGLPATLPPLPGAPTATLPPSTTPVGIVGTFGPITFAAGIIEVSTFDFKPVDAATSFPEGVTQVYAIFSYEGMSKGIQWRWERYFNGKLQEKISGTSSWDLAENGTTWLNLWSADGPSPGEWELRLYIKDKLVQKGTFTIEKRQPDMPFFGPIRFAEGITDDKPVNPHKPIDSFKAGTKEVYAFFDAGSMTKGLKWKTEWYRDGKLLEGIGGPNTWDAGQTEKDWWVKLKNLDPGTYELKLYIEDKLVQLGTFVVEK